jgi:hypothetical protein
MWKMYFLYISLGFKSFEHVEKKLKVILCLGPSSRLLQKSTKIFHLTKSNELKIWELGIDIFFHVIPKFEIDLSSCVNGWGLKSCWWQNPTSKKFQHKFCKWNNYKQNKGIFFWIGGRSQIYLENLHIKI